MSDSSPNPKLNRRASYTARPRPAAFNVALQMSKQMKHVRSSAGALVGRAHELLAFSDSDDSADEGNAGAFAKKKGQLRGAARWMGRWLMSW